MAIGLGLEAINRGLHVYLITMGEVNPVRISSLLFIFLWHYKGSIPVIKERLDYGRNMED
ncbi:hypothetical protein [Niallia taxi]|uniref:hypothetical protein n=1 Tax=Niallia taxi TaxID=2499688 RepID=UPI00254FEEB8|nr:hypothetical protein [Niallia taxi]MDK8643755.1 hypothetical protein [Niallia taxi]MED4057649.1 hypothetical protein [Niallia taxi]